VAPSARSRAFGQAYPEQPEQNSDILAHCVAQTFRFYTGQLRALRFGELTQPPTSALPPIAKRNLPNMVPSLRLISPLLIVGAALGCAVPPGQGANAETSGGRASTDVGVQLQLGAHTTTFLAESHGSGCTGPRSQTRPPSPYSQSTDEIPPIGAAPTHRRPPFVPEPTPDLAAVGSGAAAAPSPATGAGIEPVSKRLAVDNGPISFTSDIASVETDFRAGASSTTGAIRRA
jgi:hypothetical protein